MIQFEWPWVFALLPLPFLLRWLLPAATPQQAALRVPVITDYKTPQSVFRYSIRSSFFILLLAALAWCCLIAAASRPIWLGEPVDIPVSGRDLMLVVDLSDSMQVEDFVVNKKAVDRLTAIKFIAGDFIRRRQGDRIGLILFGEQAYLQTPLTFDLATVNTLLQESFIGMAGSATAMGDAIGLGVKRLQQQKDSRVLILLTDGANTAGEVSPLKAAELAAEHGLKIYTIGIGADEMWQRTLFGNRQINPSLDLDEKTLRAIAEQTGGLYFRARDTQELEKIYQELDQLEPAQQESETFRPVSSLFYWPLAAALVLASLVMLLRAFKTN